MALFGFLKKNEEAKKAAGPKEAPRVMKNPYGIKPLVELKVEDKKRLVAGIKEVLERACEKEILDFEPNYAEVISEPEKLRAFLKAVEDNLETFSDLIRTPEGMPVSDTKMPLRCGGITLDQVCQMLVFTAARRQFGSTEAGATDRPKLRTLTPYIAFPWQLPLLKAYDYLLSEGHIQALGYHLLELRTREDLELIGRMPVTDITKVREMIGEKDFRELLRERPEAIHGILQCPENLYPLIREVVAERTWDFFSRGQIYIKAALSLDQRLIRAFRQALADAEDDAFYHLRRLDVNRSVMLLRESWKQYGPKVCVLFSDSEFVNGLLKEVVEYLYQVEADDATFAETVRLKLNALHEVVQMWLKART